MGPLLAATGCPVVLMHSRGDLRTMQSRPRLRRSARRDRRRAGAAVAGAETAGISRIRSSSTPVSASARPRSTICPSCATWTGCASSAGPLLVGASRKSFLGQLKGRGTDDRLAGSLAAAAWSASRGVEILRVHDVRETVDLLDTWTAIESRTEVASMTLDQFGDLLNWRHLARHRCWWRWSSTTSCC